MAFARAAVAASMALALTLSGCKIPSDPEKTSATVSDNILRIGRVVDPLPPQDTEAAERVARAFGARVELISAGPDALLADLEEGRVHLLLGDLSSETALRSKAAATNSFGSVLIGGQSQHRVALVRKGENLFLLRVNAALADQTESER
jgi:hypothetical protein